MVVKTCGCNNRRQGKKSFGKREHFLRGERVSEKIQIHRLSELHFRSFFTPSFLMSTLSHKGRKEREKRKRGKKVCEFEHLVDFRKSDYKSGKHLSPLSYSHKYQYSHLTTSFLMRIFSGEEKRRGVHSCFQHLTSYSETAFKPRHK